ncbi:MAG: hypothetical protein K2H96_08075, partial [Muribaculaceae bacterium]|nr:hypothetical protein [Muribaculaceae bacterium]
LKFQSPFGLNLENSSGIRCRNKHDALNGNDAEIKIENLLNFKIILTCLKTFTFRQVNLFMKGLPLKISVSENRRGNSIFANENNSVFRKHKLTF